MARRCVVCQKQTGTGNNVSHSNRTSRRTWAPNVQKVRILVDKRPMRAYVCTRCLRAGKVQRAI
ncbi:MAG: 50S ribosomal protein L28 [Firmicutes bacterium]|nr:50S ribosomal protein L28 [Bacillota bacterium]